MIQAFRDVKDFIMVSQNKTHLPTHPTFNLLHDPDPDPE